MKFDVVRFIFVLIGVLNGASCSNDAFTPGSIFSDQSQTQYPTKQLFVTESGISSPFTTLGPVEYTLRSDLSLFSNQSDLRNQAIENLKQIALERYGSSVDAIINIEFQESGDQEGYFSPNFTYARGIAIAYKSGTKSKSYSKSKRKHKAKSSKSIGNKTKIPNSSKHKTDSAEVDEELEISPSELLK
ncbi:MAG: hypothetical protein IPN42_15045 [Methylococcaceae bacterium]|nr:hypothetical protein [Methylococcaceae bacterium]